MMSRSRTFWVVLVTAVALLGSAGAAFALPGFAPASQVAPSELFTYQGHLTGPSGAVTDTCEFLASLYDRAEAGEALITIPNPFIDVVNGAFSIRLGFGEGAFNGDRRFLELAVRCPMGAGAYTTLAPRQELSPVPSALYANNAGSIPWSGVTDVPSGLAGLGAISCGEGEVPLRSGAEWICHDLGLAQGVMTQLAQFDSQTVLRLSVGPDGLGLIQQQESFYHCDNLTCSSYTANEYSTGSRYVSAIGSDGLPLIASVDDTGARPESGKATSLVVRHCEEPTCGDITVSAVATPDSLLTSQAVGPDQLERPSLAVGADGLGLISYREHSSALTEDLTRYWQHDNLAVAHCDNLACTSATTTVLDRGVETDTARSSADVGYRQVLLIGGDGLGLIAYVSESADTVKVAHCENVECTVATISTIGATDTGFPWPVSLAIGADGFGYIEFSNTLAAHCLNAACTEASVGIKGEDITYLDPDADAVDLVTTRFITGEDGQRYRVRFRNYREVGYATDWSRPRFEAFLCDDANCTSATLLFDEWFGELGTARIVSWQAQIGLDGTWLLAYSQRPLGASGPISLKTFHCDALDRCRP